ncbi:MAG: hypothetical protein P8080_00340 [Gammaproteobacteria bacterium]
MTRKPHTVEQSVVAVQHHEVVNTGAGQKYLPDVRPWLEAPV